MPAMRSNFSGHTLEAVLVVAGLIAAVVLVFGIGGEILSVLGV